MELLQDLPNFCKVQHGNRGIRDFCVLEPFSRVYNNSSIPNL